MFKVNELQGIHLFKIVDSQRGVCLHSDGSILTTSEYWPTREQAQAVLDKFQPKHVWKHGDVFKNGNKSSPGTMMYIHPEKQFGEREPQVIYVYRDTYPYDSVERYTNGATFLFNIKDKL